MESPDANDERLWTAADVAEFLQVSEGTVNQWVKHGKIPFVKAGSLNRFRRSEIEAWLESSQEPSPASEAAS